MVKYSLFDVFKTHIYTRVAVFMSNFYYPEKKGKKKVGEKSANFTRDEVSRRRRRRRSRKGRRRRRASGTTTTATPTRGGGGASSRRKRRRRPRKKSPPSCVSKSSSSSSSFLESYAMWSHRHQFSRFRRSCWSPPRAF